VEVGASTNPEAIELALVRLAERIMPSGRVELIRATGEPACRRNWQVAFPRGTGVPRREDAGMRPGESLDEIPLRCGTANHGVLRVHALAARDRPVTGEPTHRRLTTACTLAACALENARLRAEWSWEDGDERDEEWTADPATDADAPIRTSCEQPDVVRDATFLNAVLPFALGQSRRHGEPVSLLCLQLDRLGAMRDLLGPAIADGLLQDLARTVASVVRSSDIVARLDDDRIVALLVRARGADAIRVARTIGRAVAESGLGSPRLPGASVSIGVAEFPATARDAASLLDAADEAMSRARARGSNAAVLAEPRAGHSPAHAPAMSAPPAMSSCTC
jgi:diguanylate cyclase (GGDEF)-like protein